MKAKEIILLIFILTGGVFLYFAQTGKIHFYWNREEGFNLFQEEFLYQETEEIKPPFPSQIQIVNAHGKVEIQGTKEENIHILFQKKIWRYNQEQAEKAAEELMMNIFKENSQIILSTNRENISRKNFRTNFKIKIPSDTKVKVINSYGEVKASRLKKTEIINHYGSINVSGIKEELIIQNSHKDIHINDIQSNTNIESKYSSLFIRNIKGNLSIRHRYGKIQLENVSGKVNIEGNYSQVYAKNLDKPLNIESSHKKISLVNVDSVLLRCHHSPVIIEGAQGNVDIKDRYSRVHLADIQGNLKVEGKSLEVEGINIKGEEILILTSHDDLNLENFSGNTDLTLFHGDMVLKPLPLTHPLQVKGNYSNITFYWPDHQKYPLEAHAEKGKIDWELPFKSSFSKENGVSIIQAFLQEEKASSIFLSTKYGTIRIKK